MLTAFGIDTTAQAVYLAMIEHPDGGVKDVAVATGESESTVRQALDRLADRALVTSVPGGPSLVPIDPEVALPALLAKQQAEIAQRQQQVEEGRLAVAQLLASYGGQQITADSEVERLIGSAAVRARIAELCALCTDEVLSFSPTGVLSPTAAAAARPVDEEILKRDVRLRKIYLDSVRNDEFTLTMLRQEMELGGEVRTLPSLPLRMIVFDRSHVIIPVSNERCGAGGLVLTGEVIVHALTALFSSLWREAKPLTKARPRRDDELTLQEKHVLRLWAQGHTDASAARRMEVSVRTVRRLSDKLTERLGAHSRFQLGGLAIAQGWIHPDDLL